MDVASSADDKTQDLIVAQFAEDDIVTVPLQFTSLNSQWIAKVMWRCINTKNGNLA